MLFSLDRFTRYSINTIVTQVIVSAIYMATVIITARYLGPHGKGLLTLILLIPMLSISFGRMGIGHGVNYYASKVSPTKLVVNSFVLCLIISLALFFATLLLVFALKDVFFKEISEKTLIVICSTVPFFLFYDYLPSVLQGLFKINKRNFLISVQPAVYLILLLVLVVVVRLGLWGAVIAWIIALFLSVAVSFMFVFKEIQISEIGLDMSFMKNLLSFGMKSHIGNILKRLSYRGDILIVSYFLDPIAVGFYSVAVNVAEIIWKFPEAVGIVLLPHVAQMNKKEAKSFTPQVCRIVLFPVMIACFMIFLFNKVIIILAFGYEFLPSSSALLILLPGILSFTVWKIIVNDLIAQGYPTRYSLSSGIALVTMLLLDIWLIPKFGINGAALASSIAYLAATVSIIIFYHQITRNSVKELLVPVKKDLLFYKKLLMIKEPESTVTKSS